MKSKKTRRTRAVAAVKKIQRQSARNGMNTLAPSEIAAKIKLKPHLRRVYRLEDLVKRITPKNVHSEIDTGTPVGREIW